MKQHAFTLVELIVVITILAILGTIGFVSLSGYTLQARDATRITDLSQITKALGNTISKGYPLPLPSKYITITVGSTLQNYQGYAGSGVLSSIGVSPDIKDPLDGSLYTYSVNATQTKHQILGFLESQQVSNIQPLIFADLSDYSGRSIRTQGDGIGILLQSGTNVPIQSNGSNVDLSTSLQSFTLVVESGKTPLTLSAKNLISGVVNQGLIAYWGFNEGSGVQASDSTGKGGDGTLTGALPPTWTGGVIGTALNFTNLTQTGFVDIGPLTHLSPKNISINLWVKMTALSSIGVNNTLFRNRLYGYGLGVSGTGAEKILSFGTYNGLTSQNQRLAKTDFTSYIDGAWHNIHASYGKNSVKIFIDGSLKNTIGNEGLPIAYTGGYVAIGKDGNGTGGWHNGGMDEVRVYDRELTDTEVLQLYSLKP